MYFWSSSNYLNEIPNYPIETYYIFDANIDVIGTYCISTNRMLEKVSNFEKFAYFFRIFRPDIRPKLLFRPNLDLGRFSRSLVNTLNWYAKGPWFKSHIRDLRNTYFWKKIFLKTKF